MHRVPTRIIGIVLGLTLAAVVLSLASRYAVRGGPPAGPVISECDGAIQSLVIQYVDGAEFALPVYQAFLRQLPPQVAVIVLCPDQATYDQLVARVRPLACSLRPVFVGHAMTAWSRDRWIARRASPAEPISLLSPRGEAGSGLWPARAGDQQLAFDLAAAMPAQVSAQRSELYFDGGDFLADDDNVFVAPAVVQRNVQHTVIDQAGLKAALSRSLKKNIVLLHDAPDHHVGMYMASVGRRTVLVGDPSLARDFAHAELPGGPDFSSETQSRYNAVAGTLARLGYRVVRMPLIPSTDGRTFFTYVNGIIDQRAGRRIVYMPVYRGCEAMNSAAESVWAKLGYEVRPVDCTSTYRLFGNLHCLVNVLERQLPE